MALRHASDVRHRRIRQAVGAMWRHRGSARPAHTLAWEKSGVPRGVTSRSGCISFQIEPSTLWVGFCRAWCEQRSLSVKKGETAGAAVAATTSMAIGVSSFADLVLADGTSPGGDIFGA